MDSGQWTGEVGSFASFGLFKFCKLQSNEDLRKQIHLHCPLSTFFRFLLDFYPKLGYNTLRCYAPQYLPLAQLDRVPDSDSVGRGFKSPMVGHYHQIPNRYRFLLSDGLELLYLDKIFPSKGDFTRENFTSMVSLYSSNYIQSNKKDVPDKSRTLRILNLWDYIPHSI